MTIIRVRCPQCGEQHLRPEDIGLHISDDPRRSWFAYDCPTCTSEVREIAFPPVVRLLISGGVDVIREPAPLTCRDLVRFVIQLHLVDDLAGQAGAQ